MSSSSSSSHWTAERIEVLSGLWRDGLSAAQIARALGGTSRNAVIGKIHRLGLSARATPTKPGRRAMPTSSRAVRRPRGAVAAKPAVGRAGASAVKARPSQAAPIATSGACTLPEVPRIHDATGLTARACRWPIGEPGASGFGYCGVPVQRSGPYCEAHRGMAYARPVRWQIEAARPPSGWGGG